MNDFLLAPVNVCLNLLKFFQPHWLSEPIRVDTERLSETSITQVDVSKIGRIRMCFEETGIEYLLFKGTLI